MAIYGNRPGFAPGQPQTTSGASAPGSAPQNRPAGTQGGAGITYTNGLQPQAPGGFTNAPQPVAPGIVPGHTISGNGVPQPSGGGVINWNAYNNMPKQQRQGVSPGQYPEGYSPGSPPMRSGRPSVGGRPVPGRNRPGVGTQPPGGGYDTPGEKQPMVDWRSMNMSGRKY